MNKLISVLSFLVIGVVVFAFSGNSVSAASTNGTLRHAYKPFVVDSTRAMRARIDNFSTSPQSRLVCVEAFNQATGAKSHLGCLTLDLAAYNSMEAWAVEFDAPTYWLKPGSYRVVYTYQATDGSWHRIKSIFLQQLDGMYRSV